MGRLKPMPPRLKPMPPRLTFAQGDTAKARLERNPLRALYNTAKWKALRWDVLAEARFTCAMCGRLEADTSKLVCDHIEAHRGDVGLFWARANLQCLCKACHDGDKQRAEQPGAERAAAFGRSGGAALMARPSWFRPVHVPLTIVCGPPGAGKSHFVRTHAGPNDLVICFERIAADLFGPGRLNARDGEGHLDRVGDVLRRRNNLLGDLMRASAKDKWPAAWMILTEPDPVHRQWWQDHVAPERIVVLETDAALCLRRIAADRKAGDVRGPSADNTVRDWWRSYRPRPGDQVIRQAEQGQAVG